MKNRAVFIDRDGTINPDSGFITKPEDFSIYPFAAEAVKMLNENGFYVFLVTNQSAIARGIITFTELAAIHQKMISQLAEKKAYIDRIFVSPYYPEGVVPPYNRYHIDRKPGIGMFNQAKDIYSFDTKRSYMIGDRYSDIVFGRTAGLKTVLVRTGEGEETFIHQRGNWTEKPDIIVKNILTAAKYIIQD